ncbi:MAG: serine/threonine-protein kinase, partial [Nocardioides sp.]
VVTFECLTSRRPFVGETPIATALAHLREPVPPLPASIPADLAAVVTRSLSKDPEQRFTDGTAFAAALRNPSGVAAATALTPAATEATQVMTGVAPPSAAPPDDQKKRGMTWLWVVLAVVLVVGIVALIAVAATNDDDDDPTVDEPTSTRTSQTRESPSEPGTTEPTPEETTPTETAPESFSLDSDNYVGRDIRDVEADLRALGLEPTRERLDNDGSQEQDTVESLRPTDDLREGDTITVRYWGKPAPVEPTEPTTAPTRTTPTSPTSPTTPTSPTAPTTSATGESTGSSEGAA